MNARSARGSNKGVGQVRIIGGRWRGTKLPVTDRPGLRPTSDRVRETLFNWLQPALPGAKVLDLFAGSGALGLEAVSRGAAHAQLVEADPGLAAALADTVRRLDAGDVVAIHRGDALSWMRTNAGPFDIAFVDPPFADALWAQVVALLPALLGADAWLYLESPAGEVPAMSAEWRLHREGATRDVRYALYRRGTLDATSTSGDLRTT